MQKIFQQLYKLDSKGKTRVWYMEQDGDKYRTYDGVVDGTVKCSAWRTAKPTNVGRSNERNAVEQATFEVEANYTKQLKGAYYEDINDIGLGCRYTEPMLAEKYKNFEPGYAQPKLDGIRCVLKADGGFSREGERIPGADHIVVSLKPLFDRAPNLILDGELYNHDLRADFNELVSLIKNGSADRERQLLIESTVQFHTYDIISMDAAFAKRTSALTALIKAVNPPNVVLVETVKVETKSEYDELHSRWIEEGFEGSMWRDAHVQYEEGKRSKSLQKRKDFDDAEFDLIPGGIEQGEGNWAGAAKRAIFWLPNADRTVDLSDKKAREENTFEAGIAGKYDANVEILANADRYASATVRFFGYTPSDIPKPRFGVVKAFFEGKRDI